MAVRINQAELQRELQVIGERAVAAEANRIRNNLVRTTPRDSGRTANAWRIRQNFGASLIFRAEIVNDVRAGDSGRYVWELLHEGTGTRGPSGRLIVPVRRQALRWPTRGGGRGSDGGFTFSAWSRGIRPDDFVVQSLMGSTDFRVTITSQPGTRLR